MAYQAGTYQGEAGMAGSLVGETCREAVGKAAYRAYQAYRACQAYPFRALASFPVVAGKMERRPRMDSRMKMYSGRLLPNIVVASQVLSLLVSMIYRHNLP